MHFFFGKVVFESQLFLSLSSLMYQFVLSNVFYAFYGFCYCPFPSILISLCRLLKDPQENLEMKFSRISEHLILQAFHLKLATVISNLETTPGMWDGFGWDRFSFPHGSWCGIDLWVVLEAVLRIQECFSYG